ncbi:High-affinity glucose transporter ght1 [Paramyrothecium foliicola]|nr:High-affinity glucose transporter ght1 [Paramyrothecium foliicola]
MHFRGKLTDFTAAQIRDRIGLNSPLRKLPFAIKSSKTAKDALSEGDVSSATIRSDLESIITSKSGIDAADWDKAIFVAKAGNHRVPLRSRDASTTGPFELTDKEAESLRAERESLSSQKGIAAIIITVALAAFLQGHVQSSINAGSLYAHTLGITASQDSSEVGTRKQDFQLGAMNASPFFTAAILGAPLSLPTNYYIGRRGALLVSAVLIIVSSLASSFSKTWVQLLGVRIIGGVGMGIKAVSAPILASETSAGYWRGSIMLTWQLWVACGIMLGFVVNLTIAAITGALSTSLEEESTQHQEYLTTQLILGAPAVPSILLFMSVYFCYESPRFYMREDSPNFDPNRALAILLAIRSTKLQAMRDLILIRWSTRKSGESSPEPEKLQPGLTTRRLRNAVWSTCTVALSQQLCGINVFAFYSNTVFVDNTHPVGVKLAMLYSFGYGAVNFFFGLGAMRTIDTAGRRTWLLATLPLMSLFLLAAAVSLPEQVDMYNKRTIAGVIFIFLFTAAYAPGLGPIPFTLASESFPLSHREAASLHLSPAYSIMILTITGHED